MDPRISGFSGRPNVAAGLRVFGRLADGVSDGEAQAEALLARLEVEEDAWVREEVEVAVRG